MYAWAWDASSLHEDLNSIASMSLKAKSAPKPPPVQLFDILPIKGVLRPGQSEVIMFSFFAYQGMKASAVAMCLVEGGPTYNVSKGLEKCVCACWCLVWGVRDCVDVGAVL